jgi:L-serine deaminase
MMRTAVNLPTPAITSVAMNTRNRARNMTKATPSVPKKVRFRAMVVGSSTYLSYPACSEVVA